METVNNVVIDVSECCENCKYVLVDDKEPPCFDCDNNGGTEHNFVSALVDHPEHYNKHPSGIECIDVIRHCNFNIGSAIKYLWRAGLKGSENYTTDLEKAIWYLKDEINRVKT